MGVLVEHLAEGVALYLGDCREILPTLPKVDAVVTDPPYMVTPTSITHYKPGGFFGGGWITKSYPVGHGRLFEVPDFAEWANLVFSVCTDSADAYFMTNDRELPRMREALEAGGWKFHNLLVWKKQSGIPNRWYFKDCEFTLYMFRGVAKTIRNPGSGQFFACAHPSPREHDSEKPTELMARYVENSTDTTQTVLDPFMGSGTTGVAAVKLGREFIGIEIEPKYFDIACRRVSEAIKQPDFFIERSTPAKQESLAI